MSSLNLTAFAAGRPAARVDAALRRAVAAGEIGWTKARHVARAATETTEADWVARGKALGRRQLAAEVAKARGEARARRQQAAAKVAPEAVAGDPPTVLSIRLTGPQRACYEALVEQGDFSRKKSAGPPVQIVLRQDPDGDNPAVVTSLGEKRLSPAEAAVLWPATATAASHRAARPRAFSRSTTSSHAQREVRTGRTT